MFTKFIKSVLIFNQAQSKAPNFILIYFLISITWHNQVFMTFITSQGSLTERFSTALSQSTHQYIVVLMLTLLFFSMRLLYLYFVNKTEQLIEQDEPIEAKLGSDQLFTENKDVVRLMDLLEETKEKLAKSKAREAQTQTDKTITINKMLALQDELDLALADIAILNKANKELTTKLNDSYVT